MTQGNRPGKGTVPAQEHLEPPSRQRESLSLAGIRKTFSLFYRGLNGESLRLLADGTGIIVAHPDRAPKVVYWNGEEVELVLEAPPAQTRIGERD